MGTIALITWQQQKLSSQGLTAGNIVRQSNTLSLERFRPAIRARHKIMRQGRVRYKEKYQKITLNTISGSSGVCIVFLLAEGVDKRDGELQRINEPRMYGLFPLLTYPHGYARHAYFDQQPVSHFLDLTCLMPVGHEGLQLPQRLISIGGRLGELGR